MQVIFGLYFIINIKSMIYTNHQERGSAALATIVVVLILVVVAVVYFVTQKPQEVAEVIANNSKEASLTVPTEPVAYVTDEVELIEEGVESDEQTEPANNEVKIFNVTGKNFSFSQNEIRVNKGDTVKIVFTSTDDFHDWTVDEFDAATEQVTTGNTSEVEFVASEVGIFEYYCSVGSHRALGMVGNLIVE